MHLRLKKPNLAFKASLFIKIAIHKWFVEETNNNETYLITNKYLNMQSFTVL